MAGAVQHKRKVQVPLQQFLTPALFASLSSAQPFLAPPYLRALPANHVLIPLRPQNASCNGEAKYLKDLSVRAFSHNFLDSNQARREPLALVGQRCAHSQAFPGALDVLSYQAWPALTQKARLHVATTRRLQASCLLQHRSDAMALLAGHM